MGPANARNTSNVNFFTLYLQKSKWMVQVNNFNFSQEEAAAISERDFFIVKSSATKKVIDLFGAIEKEMKEWMAGQDFGLKDLNISSGKIFRGENYKLYPYILLDYPRLFSKQSVFSFRTMFWWGHEFSFTLHLEGEALDHFRDSLVTQIEKLKGKGVYFCVNDTPWQYNFTTENYLFLDELSEVNDLMRDKPFIKISRKMTVDSHEKVYNYCMDTFKLFLSVLKSER